MWRKPGYYDERPVAGKRSSLHTEKEGLKLPLPERKAGDVTHDYSHVFGWNRRGGKEEDES